MSVLPYDTFTVGYKKLFKILNLFLKLFAVICIAYKDTLGKMLNNFGLGDDIKALLNGLLLGFKRLMLYKFQTK